MYVMQVIGINNRDLHTFHMDLTTTPRLTKMVHRVRFSSQVRVRVRVRVRVKDRVRDRDRDRVRHRVRDRVRVRGGVHEGLRGALPTTVAPVHRQRKRRFRNPAPAFSYPFLYSIPTPRPV